MQLLIFACQIVQQSAMAIYLKSAEIQLDEDF
jgi:hypothetical protein